MARFLGYGIDIRHQSSGWLWMVFDHDNITPLGRGRERTNGAAESAAQHCARQAHEAGVAGEAPAGATAPREETR